MSITLDEESRKALIAAAIEQLQRPASRYDEWRDKTPVQRIVYEAAITILQEEFRVVLASSDEFRAAVRAHVDAAIAQVVRGNDFLREKLVEALADALEDVTDRTYHD